MRAAAQRTLVELECKLLTTTGQRENWINPKCDTWVSCICGQYLKEPELVWCLVGPDDQRPDISDVGISASDGKCYGRRNIR